MGGRVWGGGMAPSPENFSILSLKMATFSAFWVLAHAARGAMAPPAPLGSASAQDHIMIREETYCKFRTESRINLRSGNSPQFGTFFKDFFCGNDAFWCISYVLFLQLSIQAKTLAEKNVSEMIYLISFAHWF